MGWGERGLFKRKHRTGGTADTIAEIEYIASLQGKQFDFSQTDEWSWREPHPQKCVQAESYLPSRGYWNFRPQSITHVCHTSQPVAR